MDTKPVDQHDPTTCHQEPCDQCAEALPFAGAGTIDFGGAPESDETPTGDGWKDGRIANLSGLDWALKKMGEKERLMSENRALVAKEVERLRRWEADENAALERSRSNLEAHVRVYAEANRETLGKTRRLPHGVVSWKKRERGAYRLDPNMTDHAARKAVLTWALAVEKEHPHLAGKLTTPKPALDLEKAKDFLAHMASGGKRPTDPPGLEWVPPGETLSIVVEEKKR